MITEDYVSFETAKLLKEKRFDFPCEVQYINCSSGHPFLTDRRDDAGCYYKNSEIGEDEYSAPTLQMAMKWLREEKHYYIQIMLDSWALGAHSGYYIVIQATDSDFEEISPIVNDVDDVFFKTPEQAAEAAVKYCLTNLI